MCIILHMALNKSHPLNSGIKGGIGRFQNNGFKDRSKTPPKKVNKLLSLLGVGMVAIQKQAIRLDGADSSGY